MATVISHLNNHTIRSQAILYDALSIIPYLNLNWRKWLLDVCQTGLPLRTTTRLWQPFRTLYLQDPVMTPYGMVQEDTFTDIAHLIQTSRFSASFISIHLRSERAVIDDGSDEVKRQGIMKEINASLNHREPRVNFGAIIWNAEKIRWNPDYPITPSWEAGCKQFVKRLCQLIVDLADQVIFPQVQRRKNMSQDSCNHLYSDGYRSATKGVMGLSTVDLEIHYFETGIQTIGVNEMRWAWKYNDLKPRAYYCTGASSYWKSRYVKPIAVKFMESLPMTTSRRRSYPHHIANMLEESDTLVIWDLESFTTSLSELRLFLWWAARLLETDPQVRQNPLRTFDYSEGIVQANVWEILDQYNDEVNCYSAYSLHRLIDDIGLDDMDDFLVHHVNSGPLGVAGNIGFSTTVHGLNTGSIAKTFNAAAAIGDDVMAIIDEGTSEKELTDKVRLIGSIPPSKFGIFGPCDETEENNGWKFVKRPLRRWKQDIVLWEQLNIPILAYVYHVESRNRKFFSEKTADKTVHRFVGQVADLLWRVQESSIDFQPGELAFLASYLGEAYKHLGVPPRGCLPGRKIVCCGEDVVMNYAVPPIDFHLYNPVDEDWAEYLWNSMPQSYTYMPIDAGSELLPEYDEASEVYATETGVMKILEDLGFVSKPIKQMEWVKVEEQNYRRFRSQLHGDTVPLVKYRWLKFPPVWYDHFLIPRYTLGRSSLETDSDGDSDMMY